MNIDINSPEWQKISTFVDQKIDDLRKSNDSDLNEIETADVRGQIKFAKSVLKLGEKKETQQVGDQTYL